MLMPFASAFTVYNLGISLDNLPLIYMATGICSMIAGPIIGKLSDQVGKYRVFFFGTVLTMLIVAWYCNLGPTPLWLVIIFNIIMFAGVTARIISASALMTAVPDAADRGAFMSIQSSVQQISGGIASAAAGMIVVQNANGVLRNYDVLGYVVVLAMAITLLMMYVIDQQVKRKGRAEVTPSMAPATR